MNSSLHNSEFGKYSDAMKTTEKKSIPSLREANDESVDSFCAEFFSEHFEDDGLVLKAEDAKTLAIEFIMNRDTARLSKGGKQKKAISDPISSGQALLNYFSKNRSYLDALVARNTLAEIKHRDMYAAFSFEDLRPDKIDEYLLQNVCLPLNV